MRFLTTNKQLCALALLFVLLLLCSFLIPRLSVQAVQPDTEPLQMIQTSQKAAAITFDVDTDAGQISRILRVLRNKKAKATFFVTGVWAQKYPNQLRQIAEEGQELSCHGNVHRDMTLMTVQQQKEDLLTCIHTIREESGVTPVWLRPPYRKCDDQLIRVAHSLDLRVADCSVVTDDWRNVAPQVIRRQAVSRLCPGGILLLNCSALNTASALPLILQDLQQKGYQCCTLSHLAKLS